MLMTIYSFVIFFGMFATLNSRVNDDHISLSPKVLDIKNFYKGVIFKTSHGLVISYFGSRYSRKYLLDFLSECSSSSEEYSRLLSLQFEVVTFNPANHSLEINDSLHIEAISFHLTYKNDNLIQSKVYDKKSSRILGYYSSYLSVAGLDLDKQHLKPIKLADIKCSLDKLRAHFVRLGYVYVDIGYQLLQNSSGHLSVVYMIDLADLQANSLELIDGNQVLNSILVGKCPRYAFALFEIANNYFLNPQFIDTIKQQYYDAGYFNIKLSSYYDFYKKKLVYPIDSGQKFVISGYDFDFSNTDDFISSDKKNLIRKILLKNGAFFSAKKISLVKDILGSIYKDKDFSVSHSLNLDRDNNSVFILFSFKMEHLNPKRILRRIKSIGNSGVGSDQLNQFLSKKIGDMISLDDIDDLRSDLFRTGCFERVSMELKENEDHSYDLIINVKEVLLWIIPDFRVGYDKGLSFAGRAGKRNFNNSGSNLLLDAVWSNTDSSRKHISLNLFVENFLPNGSTYKLGGRISFLSDFTSSKSFKEKVFEQDAGSTIEGFLETQILGFTHTLTLTVRKFSFDKQFLPLFSLLTEIMNKSIFTLHSATTFRVDNEIVLKLCKQHFESPHDKLNFSLKHIHILSDNGRFIGGVFLYAGHSFFFNKDDKYKRYFVYQGFSDFSMGYWGPKSGKQIIGGDTRVGVKLKLNYSLQFEWVPSSLNGSSLYTHFEIGSIFNLKDNDVHRNIRYGIAAGIEVPFMGAQLVFRFFYFYPMNKKPEDKAITDQGFHLELDLNSNRIVQSI